MTRHYPRSAYGSPFGVELAIKRRSVESRKIGIISDFMKPLSHLAKYLSAGAVSLALLAGGVVSAQASPNVTDVRIGSSNERTRLVLDL